ncbi:MAG: hypothetical protein Q9173_002923 [Seirophora scorigena]
MESKELAIARIFKGAKVRISWEALDAMDEIRDEIQAVALGSDTLDTPMEEFNWSPEYFNQMGGDSSLRRALSRPVARVTAVVSRLSPAGFHTRKEKHPRLGNRATHGFPFYTSLPDQHIRLLELLPGAFEDPICVKLAPVELGPQQKPSYHALSYAWGSPNFDHDIRILSGSSFQLLPVTENLHIALQHLRWLSASRILWIDAVCINQSDTEERSQQVARMAEVYRSAEKVVIWLGPEENGSDLALAAMATIASKLQVDWARFTINLASEDTAFSWLDLNRRLPFDDETHRSIVFLLERPWFERLWIWQEVFLAADRAEILCGNTTVTWDVFRTAVYCLEAHPRPDTYLGINRALKRARQISVQSGGQNLRRTLADTKHAQCSDPRDRIFAILYLVPEYHRLDIQPDYSKSAAEVFRNVMLRSIFNKMNADILSCCEVRSEPTISPSWVPDWASPRRCETIGQPRACWKSFPHAKYDGDGILTMTGVCVTRITRSCDILPAGSLELSLLEQYSDLRVLYTALRKVLSILQANSPLYLEQNAEMACRTLCCNKFSYRFEPLNESMLDFPQTMTRFLRLADSTEEVSYDFLWECSFFLNKFYECAVGRAFIVTHNEGLIGLAPEACRENDCIVILLGCQSPMVLRPTDDGSFLVVGECYVEGLMEGEALLGPLPSNWRRVVRFDEETKEWWGMFKDRDQGVCQVEDPRLGPLPKGWYEVEHPKQPLRAVFRDETKDVATHFDPRMLPSSLRERGVELQDFNLV